MKKFKIVLFLALVFVMLFAGSVHAEELTDDDIDFLYSHIKMKEYEIFHEDGSSERKYGIAIDKDTFDLFYERDIEISVNEFTGKLELKKSGSNEFVYFNVQTGDENNGSFSKIDRSDVTVINVGDNNITFSVVERGEEINSISKPEQFNKQANGGYFLYLCDMPTIESNFESVTEEGQEEQGDKEKTTLKLVDNRGNTLKSNETGEEIAPQEIEKIMELKETDTVYEIEDKMLDFNNTAPTKIFKNVLVWREDAMGEYTQKGTIDIKGYRFKVSDEYTDTKLTLWTEPQINEQASKYVASLNGGETRLAAIEIGYGYIYVEDYERKEFISVNKINSNADTDYYFEEDGEYWVFIPEETEKFNFEEEEESEGGGLFKSIEEVLADAITGLGKHLIIAVSASLGKTITLDNVIFNEYDETKLELFTYRSSGEVQYTKSTMVQGLIEPINIMYNIFRSIAVVGYVAILVYIGVQIMLSSTNAKKKATYKEMLSFWVVGIVILFMFPYVMRYAIEANDAIVSAIGDTRSILAKNASATWYDMSDKYRTLNIFSFKVNQILQYRTTKGVDYMSVIGFYAQETHKLGVAIAYIITCWQLIAMLVYYYKRVFVIAFLIMIFPLVALMFIWDKLNDGKSQSLAAWTQEFFTAVFVQTFHAIIYVFITNAIYETVSNETFDFILLMCASTFLFLGEDIVKQIFGAGDTVATGSAAAEGGAVLRVAGITKAVTVGLIKNTVGKEGLTRKTISNFKEKRKFNMMNKKADDGTTYHDQQARNERLNQIVPPFLPKDGAASDDVRQVAENTAIVNDCENQDSKDVAAAMDKLTKLLNKYEELRKKRNEGSMTDAEKEEFDNNERQINAIMNKSKVSPEQIKAWNQTQVNAAKMAANGEKRRKIVQEMKLEVSVTFPDKNEKGQQVVAQKMLKAAVISMATHGASQNITRSDIERDWSEKDAERKSFESGAKFAPEKRRSTRGDSRRSTMNLHRSAINQRFEREIPGFAGKSALEKKKYRAVAESIAVISALKSGSGFDNDYEADFYEKHYRVLTANYGSDQALIDDCMTLAGVSAADLRAYIDSASKTRKNEILDNRVEGLIKQYEGEFGPIDPAEEPAIREAAKYVVTIEQLGTKAFSLHDSFEAITGLSNENHSFDTLDNHDEKIAALLRLSNLKADIETLRAQLAELYKQEKARGNSDVDGTVDTWLNDELNRISSKGFSVDPVVQIYDIINAGGKRRLKNAAIDDKERTAQLQNTREMTASKKFAKSALEGFIKDREFGIFSDPEPEKVANGMTAADIKAKETEAFLAGARGLVKLATVVPTTIVGGIGGMTLGMGTTQDGMPINEGLEGALTGILAVNGVTDTGINLASGKLVSDAVDKHIENKAADRIKAMKDSTEKEKKANNDADDEKPIIDGVSGTLFEGADGNLFVEIDISARNAVSISASTSVSSSGATWLPYQTKITLAIGAPNPGITTYTVYVKIKGPAGDIRIGRINNLKL